MNNNFELDNFISKDKLSDQVCRFLRDLIITRELKSGERIVETKFAKQLGVSQAPVREALRELEMMGLVEIKPYTGCFVAPFDKKKLKQIYHLRSMLECEAICQGTENMTDGDLALLDGHLQAMYEALREQDMASMVQRDVDFHRVFVRSAHNAMLEKMWQMVNAHQWSAFTATTYTDTSYVPDSHIKLLELAAKRDKDGIVAEMTRHLTTAAEAAEKAVRDE